MTSNAGVLCLDLLQSSDCLSLTKRDALQLGLVRIAQGLLVFLLWVYLVKRKQWRGSGYLLVTASVACILSEVAALIPRLTDQFSSARAARFLSGVALSSTATALSAVFWLAFTAYQATQSVARPRLKWIWAGISFLLATAASVLQLININLLSFRDNPIRIFLGSPTTTSLYFTLAKIIVGISLFLQLFILSTCIYQARSSAYRLPHFFISLSTIPTLIQFSLSYTSLNVATIVGQRFLALMAFIALLFHMAFEKRGVMVKNEKGNRINLDENNKRPPHLRQLSLLTHSSWSGLGRHSRMQSRSTLQELQDIDLTSLQSRPNQLAITNDEVESLRTPSTLYFPQHTRSLSNRLSRIGIPVKAQQSRDQAFSYIAPLPLLRRTSRENANRTLAVGEHPYAADLRPLSFVAEVHTPDGTSTGPYDGLSPEQIRYTMATQSSYPDSPMDPSIPFEVQVNAITTPYEDLQLGPETQTFGNRGSSRLDVIPDELMPSPSIDDRSMEDVSIETGQRVDFSWRPSVDELKTPTRLTFSQL